MRNKKVSYSDFRTFEKLSKEIYLKDAEIYRQEEKIIRLNREIEKGGQKFR